MATNSRGATNGGRAGDEGDRGGELMSQGDGEDPEVLGRADGAGY